MAWTRGCVVLLALGVVACDPLVSLDETSGSSGSSTGSVGSSGFGPSSATSPVPPNPTTPTPTGCAPGTYIECTCPGGGYGEQICSSDGAYGSCECYGGDITWGTSGSSGWWGSSGSSGWWGSSSGSSSSGGWSDPRIPELPPGEDCLGLDLPCVGNFDVASDDELEAVGVCSVVEGELFIHSEVSTLQPLGCLRQVDGFTAIIETSVTNLSGLVALEYTGGLAVVQNTQLSSIDIPALETVGDFYVQDNPVLLSFDLPNLTEIIETLDVFGNLMLPACEVQELVAQSSPPNVTCEGNLADMCVGLCG